MMDSSFLTWIKLGLGLYSAICFIKMMIQFGLSNHPGRLTTTLTSLCVAAYFVGQALAELGFMAAVEWLRWRSLPMIAGSLALLLQVIVMGTQFSLIQQKLISRVPIITSLLAFAFFSSLSDVILAVTLATGSLFLTVSVGKVRYQKRQYAKMVFFISLSSLCKMIDQYWFQVLGEVLIFAALFYFFIFEQAFAIAGCMNEFKTSLEGES